MNLKIVYSAPFFLSAILIFIVALFTYRRRKIRGAWYLIFLCLSGGFWAASEGLLYLGFDAETNILITFIQYLGVAPLPPLALLFTLSVLGFENWVNRKTILLLAANAVIVIGLVWTNPMHRLVFVDYFIIDSGPFPMLGLEHGPVWWCIIGYHYLLLAILWVILLQQMLTTSSLRRSQAGVLLVSISIVWAVNALYASGHSPIPNMDMGPLGFIAVALSMAWGFFRYNLLDILPIAKSEIYNGLNLPILVLDKKNRILDINPATESIFKIHASESIGKEIGQILGNHPQLNNLPNDTRTIEVDLLLGHRQRFFDLRISALNDKRNRRIGRIIILQDITERKRAEEAQRESEKLQGVLEMAGAVSHDLSQPLMAIMGYADLISMEVSENDSLNQKITKLDTQAKRLGELAQNLMRITRYETRKYLGRQIIDIQKSSQKTEANT